MEVTHRGNVRRKYRVAGLTSQPTRELVCVEILYCFVLLYVFVRRSFILGYLVYQYKCKKLYFHSGRILES